MLVILTCLLAAAAAAPASYDERQDGELNVRADVQNVVLLFALPQYKMPSAISLFGDLLKSSKQTELQERADIQVMKAFVEPSTPYRVEIGNPVYEEGDGRAVEVVIASRRRDGSETQAELQAEPQAEPQAGPQAEQQTEPQTESDQDEYKLLGATEQCGPDRVRDSVTLMCRDKSVPQAPVVSPAAVDDNKPIEPAPPAPEAPASS